MSNIYKVRNTDDYSRYLEQTDKHPLVSVIDHTEVSPIRHCQNNYSTYGMFTQEHLPVELTYGCSKYDYTSGTLICVAPGQVLHITDEERDIFVSLMLQIK